MYYYCGFRTYISISYSPISQQLIVAIGAYVDGNWRIVTERLWVDVLEYEIELKEEIKEFSGFGSGYVWVLAIRAYTYTGVGEAEIPIWSAFYQADPPPEHNPFPIEVYSDRQITLYDCPRAWSGSLCPSKNPVVCALWSFFKILADFMLRVLPEPIKSVFSLFGVLFSVLASLFSILLNSTFISILLLVLPLILLTYIYVESVEHGGFGVFRAFIVLFDFMKKIVELIINALKAILPF
jgi:hypothetical protein